MCVFVCVCVCARAHERVCVCMCGLCLSLLLSLSVYIYRYIYIYRFFVSLPIKFSITYLLLCISLSLSLSLSLLLSIFWNFPCSPTLYLQTTWPHRRNVHPWRSCMCNFPKHFDGQRGNAGKQHHGASVSAFSVLLSFFVCLSRSSNSKTFSTACNGLDICKHSYWTPPLILSLSLSLSLSSLSDHLSLSLLSLYSSCMQART